jgi:four helix bundle protein
MRDFRKIKAWQLADDLTVEIYAATRSFPKEEVYGLTSQVRRASASIAANIAEGASRSSPKEYLQHLYIARGSCSETQYFIHLASRLKYLEPDAGTVLASIASQTAQTLYGLIRAVETESR